jgi:hypothetical protein
MTNKSNLNAVQIAEAAKIGAQAGINAFSEQQKNHIKKVRDKKLKNTRLLLKNYRMIKEHADNAIFEVSKELQEKMIHIINLMWETPNTDLTIESIKKSIERTKLLIEHTDSMLKVYKTACEKSCKPENMRQYRIIDMLYIQDNQNINIAKIAAFENIDERTVYRDITIAVEKISVLLFGIDSLELT